MRYVAISSFTDPTDGQEIVAGRTTVSGNSDVYRLFPERFRAAPGGDSRFIRTGGGGTATIVRGAVTEPKLPIFLETLPPQSLVRLSSSVLRSMRDECRRMWLQCRGDMHETGGWLMSHRRSPDELIHATAPGSDATHSRSSMRLGTEHLEQVQDFLPHLRVTGSYHVHPGDDDGVPSEADRKAWARWRELDGGFHVGLILIRGETSGWMDPQIRAWLTTSEFCEPLAWKEF